MKKMLLPYLFVIPPLFLFIWHASLFGNWLIDDAGISFVYSRNLAQGHGLVAQPGDLPVEGYSNPAWVGLIALFFFFDIFQPVATTKILSVVLVGIGFMALVKSMQKDQYGWLMSVVALSMLSMNTSFVIWTTSGLENPLYFASVAVLFYLTVRIVSVQSTLGRESILAGIVAGIVALTRPDGIVFGIFFPLVLCAQHIRQKQLMHAIKPSLFYAGTMMSILGSYVLFRLWYFGSLYPNTYLVKGGPTTESVISLIMLRSESLTKAFDLINSMFAHESGITIVALGLLAICMVALYIRKQLTQVLGLGGLFAIMALVVYVLLPLDWMFEYRFATIFFPFLYLVFAMVAVKLFKEYFTQNIIVLTLTGCFLLVYAIMVVPSFSTRTMAFAQAPTAPFSYVSEHFGHQFNRYAELLEVSNGSLLTPDVGGALYYSNLKIYDLAGLTDMTIAKTLEKDPKALNEYIFEYAKPTFIHVHGWFSFVTYFENDVRFTRDYIPLYSQTDILIRNMYGVDRITGDFVRKDAVIGKETELELIRSEYLTK